MNLQYISDAHGQTTGVFIPIEEWNALKQKFKGIEHTEAEIPIWQMEEVRERLAEYQANPALAENFDQALADIENSL